MNDDSLLTMLRLRYDDLVPVYAHGVEYTYGSDKGDECVTIRFTWEYYDSITFSGNIKPVAGYEYFEEEKILVLNLRTLRKRDGIAKHFAFTDFSPKVFHFIEEILKSDD